MIIQFSLEILLGNFILISFGKLRPVVHLQNTLNIVKGVCTTESISGLGYKGIEAVKLVACLTKENTSSYLKDVIGL